jgi:hypothetical protein
MVWAPTPGQASLHNLWALFSPNFLLNFPHCALYPVGIHHTNAYRTSLDHERSTTHNRSNKKYTRPQLQPATTIHENDIIHNSRTDTLYHFANHATDEDRNTNYNFSNCWGCRFGMPVWDANWKQKIHQ